MIPPHTKAIPLNRLPVVRKHGEALFLPRRRPNKEKGGFEKNAPPGPSPPHAASRTLFRTKKSVRSDAHCVGRAGLRLSPAGQGGALPRFARPAARCRPSQTRRCRRVVRLGANTLHGGSAACPKRRVRRRTGARPPRAQTARAPAPPGPRDGQLCEKASPGPTPPHAASRTLFRTKKSVRSDAHCVGRTGLRLSPVRQGGALARFARPAARCRPSQTRHCRRVVRLGANTLHGTRAACPKRRVRRRTVTRPPRAKLPTPPPPGQRKGQL